MHNRRRQSHREDWVVGLSTVTVNKLNFSLHDLGALRTLFKEFLRKYQKNVNIIMAFVIIMR